MAILRSESLTVGAAADRLQVGVCAIKFVVDLFVFELQKSFDVFDSSGIKKVLLAIEAEYYRKQLYFNDSSLILKILFDASFLNVGARA